MEFERNRHITLWKNRCLGMRINLTGEGHNLWDLLPKEREIICCVHLRVWLPLPGQVLGYTYFLLKGCWGKGIPQFWSLVPNGNVASSELSAVLCVFLCVGDIPLLWEDHHKYLVWTVWFPGTQVLCYSNKRLTSLRAELDLCRFPFL